MTARIGDDALTVLCPAAVASPVAVAGLAGWQWAALYVAVAVVVVAVGYAVSSARSRRAFRRFLWRRLPRGRRRLRSTVRPSTPATR